MKFLPIFSILALALGNGIIRPGSMYISSLDKAPHDQQLRFKAGKLVAGDQHSTFAFSESGLMKSSETGKYLGVNELGQFVSTDTPHLGFSLRTEECSQLKRRLAYQGEDKFEICPDNSIGHKSNCEGAREIEITYEDHVQPR